MRLLSVWDFRTVPYSIGDLLTLLERLQIEKEINRVDQFDIAFVYDKNCPARTHNYNTKGELVESSGSQKITAKNFHHNLLPLISAVFTSKNLGNFFIFDDYEKLYKFMYDNEDDYFFYPSLTHIKSQKHCYRDNFNFIQDYFKKHKRIPYLECREGTIENVNQFYHGLFTKYPVTCHIRNTESMNARNSDQTAWMNFFNYCKDKYKDIIFILIGTKNDTKPFRRFSNVMISKDYFNTVEEDMILIRQSLFFMGTRSGPLMMALFTGIPCVIFDYHTAPHEICKPDKNFNFMNKNQKLIWKKADFEILKNEFEKLYKKVNKNSWINKIEKQKNNNKSNLELI